MIRFLSAWLVAVTLAGGVTAQGPGQGLWVDVNGSAQWSSNASQFLGYGWLNNLGQTWSVDAIAFECLSATDMQVVTVYELPNNEVIYPTSTDQALPYLVFRCYSVSFSTLAGQVKMTFSYHDQELPGSESSMRLFSFDVNQNKWFAVSGTVHDTNTNKIYVSPLMSGGLYGIGVDVSQDQANAGSAPTSDRKLEAMAGPPIAIGVLILFAILFGVFRRRSAAAVLIVVLFGGATSAQPAHVPPDNLTPWCNPDNGEDPVSFFYEAMVVEEPTRTCILRYDVLPNPDAYLPNGMKRDFRLWSQGDPSKKSSRNWVAVPKTWYVYIGPPWPIPPGHAGPYVGGNGPTLCPPATPKVPPASASYRCWSATFEGCRPDRNPHNLTKAHEEWVKLNSQTYDCFTPNTINPPLPDGLLPGDKILYKKGSKITHAGTGIAGTPNNRVRSKLGSFPFHDHDQDDVPESYGDIAFIYRLKG